MEVEGWKESCRAVHVRYYYQAGPGLLMPDRSHGPMKFEAFLKLIVPHPPSFQRISSYSAGEFATYKTPQTCF